MPPLSLHLLRITVIYAILVYQYVAEEKLSYGEIFKSAWSFIHCVQSSTATVVWFHFRLARMDVRTREVGTFFENFVI